jgi:rhodanese-related sulfurtransferase
METQTILAVVSFLALASALLALRSASAAKSRTRTLERKIETLEQDVSRTGSQLREQLQNQAQLLRRVAQGKHVTEAVLSGDLFDEIDGEAALEMLRRHPDTLIIDVREPQEHAAFRIPGAKLIPLGEIGQRVSEIPQDADRIIMHCAAGGRSAQACAQLGVEGYVNLYNLAGGIGRWPGEVRRG